MATLEGTQWKFTSNNKDFVTCLATFQANNVALCEFPVAVTNACYGTWSEEGNTFVLKYNWAGTTPVSYAGNHENGNGTGTATIETATKGTVEAPFTCTKM